MRTEAPRSSLVVLPIFALANARVAFSGDVFSIGFRCSRIRTRLRLRTHRKSWFFSRDGTRLQTTLSGHVALEDENSYVAAAEAGLGIARIPAFVLKDAMERGTLELVLGDWFPDAEPRKRWDSATLDAAGLAPG